MSDGDRYVDDFHYYVLNGHCSDYVCMFTHPWSNVKKLSDVLNRQIGIMSERGWDRLYIAIDLHDTMIPSTYSNDSYERCELYEYAVEVLQWMSDCDNIRLILFTSSYDEQKSAFMRNVYDRYRIKFDYHNCNPEVSNTETGDFSSKFYYNIILDDKGGMDPYEDWKDLLDNTPIADGAFTNGIK